jgi:DNA-binding Lrp family transcriptional regulator
VCADASQRSQTHKRLDDLDRQIAVALQVNGRLSWRAIGRALDVPERTVTRRGQAMLDNGTVRVSTYLDTTRVGHARPLILTAYTEVGRSFEIGRLIAKRPDASSVSVLEGNDHLISMLLPDDDESRHQLLFHDLPAIDGLRRTTISTVLRYFRTGYDWSAGGLSDEVIDCLRDGLPANPDRTEPVHLDGEDRALVQALAENGRESIAGLAKAVNLSTQTTQRRLTQLFEEGAIHIRTEVNPHILGLNVEILAWIQVAPAEVDSLGRALATHPAVRFCAATTGPSQILLDCLFEAENDLYEFVTNYLGTHGASRIADVAVVIAALRRGPLVLPEFTL